MKKNLFFIVVMALSISYSCSRKIVVNYQTEKANTGTISLKPVKPTTKTFVTINDNLIVEKKNVKSVKILNVPNGEYKIHYSSDNSWYKNKLDSNIVVKMEGNKEVTKIVEVPPFSTGYWIYITGCVAIPIIIAVAL